MSNKYFDRPTIFVSHAIRGTSGDMKGNCRKAQTGVRKLRVLFPEVDFYLPADGDLVLQVLSNAKRLGEKDILWADFEILRACSGWFFYHFEDSFGSEQEREVAISVDFVGVGDTDRDVRYDLGKANFSKIRRTFLPIVESAIKNFRGR
ncbi:hypothetical protein LCGC14_2593100 [marine sediment metagenome]|uniref:Uncharacterized protein n=1 Tax=marine sediment metagenome TaxID=412755 RepID=A0A0F9AB26_9ZZZZ